MRRTLITTSVVAMLALAACSSGETGGSASAPAVESAPASEGASAAASPSASASGGTGMVDPASVSGDLTLQGWSAGAVEAPILQQVLDDFQAAYPQVKVKFERATRRAALWQRRGAHALPHAMSPEADHPRATHGSN